jgi:hypothetical protein
MIFVLFTWSIFDIFKLLQEEIIVNTCNLLFQVT